MTHTTTDSGAGQRYSNQWIAGNITGRPWSGAIEAMCQMRDEMTAEFLAAKDAIHAVKNGRIAELRQERDALVAQLAAAQERIAALETVIDKLDSAWFDSCQGVRDDVPEDEIYNVLAIRDGRKTIEEIREGMAQLPLVPNP